MGIAFFLFILGIGVLIGGAKLLVFGASQLAISLKISSLVIGLTVVSFGTSAPEIAFCTSAALQGEGSLLMGNIVGSNIFNILLVLGFCATLYPLAVKKQLIRWDVPIMIGFSLLVWFLAAFGSINRWDGMLLLFGIICYLLFLFKFQKKQPPSDEQKPKLQPIWLQIIWIILGLILLGFGSRWLVESSTQIARFLGVGELFIGLTIVAVGTSLPELAVSFTAILKGDRDLAVGNVIGSNLFNLLAVLGIAAFVSPTPIQIDSSLLLFDLPVMVAVSIATLPIFITGHIISRWEGVLFLFYYMLFITYLLLNTFMDMYLPLFTSAFFLFILPLTLITLVIGIFRHVYRHH